MQRPINIELNWLWREPVVIQLEVPFQNFTGETEGKHETPPSYVGPVWGVRVMNLPTTKRLRYEPGMSS